MDTDRGLARQLPPPPDPNQQANNDVKLKERNVLVVRLNFNDELMCNGEYMTIHDIRRKAKEFIANPMDDSKMPEKHPMNVPFFGDMMVTKNHVISLSCDRGTSYQAYISVQNELVAAYNELRDETAQQKWGKNYADLDEVQQEAIRKIYPQKISEAEPKSYGDKK